jgi:hypothetical protein
MHTIVPIFKDVVFSIFLLKNVDKITKLILNNGGTLCTGNNSPSVIITTQEFLSKTQRKEVLDTIRPMIYSTTNAKSILISERGINELAQIKFRIESSDLLNIVKGSDIITIKQLESLRDWNQLEKFEFFESRRLKRYMSVKMQPFEFESNEIFDMELWDLIASFLSIPDIINTFSMVSKDMYSIAHLPKTWRNRCDQTLKQYKWFPKIDLDNVNVSMYHWYKFYRKSMYPLILDKKRMKGTSCLALYMDLRRSNRLAKGSCKFGGQPDLPHGEKSPCGYIFLAQLNFLEIYNANTFSANAYQPLEGMLYFFVSNDHIQGKIIYYEGTIDDLTPYEDNFSETYPQYEIQVFESFTPPPSDCKPELHMMTYKNNEYRFQFVVNEAMGGFDEIFQFKTKSIIGNELLQFSIKSK